MIDDTDLAVLKILQKDARTTNAAIAREVGMAESATLGRLRRLEERGIIQRYEARVDPAAVGLGLLAFVAVRSTEPAGSTAVAEQLAALPEVLEVHHVAGEDCYLTKVRAADPESLGQLLRRSFGAIPEIVSTRTTIAMETVKETSALPLAGRETNEG